MKKLPLAVKRKIVQIKKYEHHPLIHEIHRRYGISRRTLFYMKKYGERSHVISVILKESLPGLAVSFVLAIIAGVVMEAIKSHFLVFIPLLILLPALNDMIGDYSMILVARLSTFLFAGQITNSCWHSPAVRRLIRTIVSVAAFNAVYIGIISSLIAFFKGYAFTASSIFKVLEVSVFTTFVMLTITILITTFTAYYVYERKIDPNNLIMPIMTSIADLGTILTAAFIVHFVL